jgi:hypothetical protein
MYRYISRESCSQFDSLPLTSLTRRSTGAFYGKGFVRCPAAATLCNAEKVRALNIDLVACCAHYKWSVRRTNTAFSSLHLDRDAACNSEQYTAAFATASPDFDRRCPAPRDLLLAPARTSSAAAEASWGALECGGVARGACTGEASVCTCAYGFAGRACEQTRCIGGCSGHGACDTLHGTCSCSATHDGPSCAAETAIGWITARPLVAIVLVGGAACVCVACICCCVWAAAVACHILKKHKLADEDGKHAGDGGIAMMSPNPRASTSRSSVGGGGGGRLRQGDVNVRRSAAELPSARNLHPGLAVSRRVGERVLV